MEAKAYDNWKGGGAGVRHGYQLTPAWNFPTARHLHPGCREVRGRGRGFEPPGRPCHCLPSGPGCMSKRICRSADLTSQAPRRQGGRLALALALAGRLESSTSCSDCQHAAKRCQHATGAQPDSVRPVHLQARAAQCPATALPDGLTDVSRGGAGRGGAVHQVKVHSSQCSPTLAAEGAAGRLRCHGLEKRVSSMAAYEQEKVLR